MVEDDRMDKDLQMVTESGIDLDAHEPAIQDWAQLVSFKPELYFRPKNVEELKGFMNSVAQGVFGRRNPRVLGGMHSCSDICVSDAIIDVSDLPYTLEFNDDASLVTVSANWHFRDFLLALSKRGKSISATGGTDEQTLAGIISTNTAPATPHTTIYELLNWVEYLTLESASGPVVEKHVSRGEPAFPAVIGSLGAIGILTRVQFRLVDQLYFETVQKIMKMKDMLSDLGATSKKYNFWRIDWIPDTDHGLVWAAQNIARAEADPEGDYADDQAENILMALYKVFDKIESAGPLLDDAMRLLYAGLALTYGETRVNGPLRRMLPVDRRAPLHVAMAEWSFNPADLERLLQACRGYFEQHGWPNLPIEIELTQTDNYWMSPWNWAGLDYIIKFNFMYLTDVIGSAAERQQMFDHLRGLWDYLRQAGIPFKAHWGKINFMDPAYVRENFNFAAFEPFICPVFLNPYLRERFYGVK
jgi:FAD/FMN-containing dehydrogenase